LKLLLDLDHTSRFLDQYEYNERGREFQIIGKAKMGVSFLLVCRDDSFHRSISQEHDEEGIPTQPELSLLQQNHKCIQEIAIASK
jgi:hypothetical protein